MGAGAGRKVGEMKKLSVKMKSIDTLALIKSIAWIFAAGIAAFGLQYFYAGIAWVLRRVDSFYVVNGLFLLCLIPMCIRYGYDYYKDVHKLKALQRALVACLVLLAAGVARAEDDYTLKDWCKPFRPRACYVMVDHADSGDRDGAREGGSYCISAVDKAVDAHPECAEYLRGFRDRMLGDVGRTENMWRSNDAVQAEIKRIISSERGRVEGLREAKSYIEEVRTILHCIK